MWRLIGLAVICVGVGVGGTMAVHHYTTVPVVLTVHVPCPVPPRAAVDPVQTEYQPQGRLLQMPRVGGQ